MLRVFWACQVVPDTSFMVPLKHHQVWESGKFGSMKWRYFHVPLLVQFGA